MKVDKNTRITDALKESRLVNEVLKKYRLDCASCRGAAEDTIERVALNNGLVVDVFLEEINNAIKNQAQ